MLNSQKPQDMWQNLHAYHNVLKKAYKHSQQVFMLAKSYYKSTSTQFKIHWLKSHEVHNKMVPKEHGKIFYAAKLEKQKQLAVLTNTNQK